MKNLQVSDDEHFFLIGLLRYWTEVEQPHPKSTSHPLLQRLTSESIEEKKAFLAVACEG